jgi:uncharacterized protein YcaQ
LARFDLKAERKQGVLRVLSAHFESGDSSRPPCVDDRKAAQDTLTRYAEALQLKLVGWRSGL